jgi:O-antigen/teichoic acid export membrane protein
MLLGVVLFNYGRSMTSYLTGINDLKAISIMIWVRSIIIFGVSILLINRLGMVAIGIGVLFCELISFVVLPNYFVRQHFQGELMEPRRYSILFHCLLWPDYLFRKLF